MESYKNTVLVQKQKKRGKGGKMRQKTNIKMVGLNPIISIITLNINV